MKYKPAVYSKPPANLVTCTTESLVSELKVSAPTERTVLSELLSQVTCNQVRVI